MIEGTLRSLKNILLLIGCLASAALLPSLAVAAPRAQDPQKQDEAASAKPAGETKPDEKPKAEEKTKADEKTNDQPDKDYVKQDFTSKSDHGFRKLAGDFLQDQKQIWTSPANLRLSDTEWLVPLSGVTAGLFVTDRDFSKHLSQDPTTISHYKTLSNAGVGALVGGGAAMWLLGHASHNEHWSETGFLAGEAALNSLVVVESFKYSLSRERPYQGDGSGAFFQSGGTSFPSEHAAAAWAVAGVIAHEYPGPLTKIFAYGLASLVDVSRIRSRQHFPSDVLVGSVIGNLVAQNIYTQRHDPELGGEAWKSISQIFRGDGTHSPANQGSPYVPLDSWIYPALDRLAAMGLIDSGFAGMRPWTRNECARLLVEVGEHTSQGTGGLEAEKIYRLLETEFRSELENEGGYDHPRAQVESVYARVTDISGQPLTDGNYFGQTIVNDFGRPYEEGFNSVDGLSAWTTSGRWAGYIRAEYQHSPSAPAEPLAARQFEFSSDGLPGVPPATPFAPVNQLQLLDAYAGLTFDNWQISFGKQSLSWSPMQSGPLMFSDNVTPINMFRVDRVSPFKLPSILGWLGPMRIEMFVGQLTAHEFVFDNVSGLTTGQFGQSLSRQPLLHGEKLSFKPTPNFEFSVNETTVFGGGDSPLTWHNFLKSYKDLLVVPTGSSGADNAEDITDPRSGIDFAYRVPGLRNWLTFYGDAFTEDEISPLGYPRKSAFQGGLYFPRIPGIQKLDLRLEGGTTAPVDFLGCGGCFYNNTRYPGGSYVNGGNLIGSWMGRGGQGESAWSTYWLSSRSKIQLHFRHQKVDGDYLPRGGTLNDGGVSLDLQLRPDLTFSGALQYEKWNYPILAPGAQSNWVTSIGFTYWPHSSR